MDNAIVEKILSQSTAAFQLYQHFSGKQKADFLYRIANEITLISTELAVTAQAESSLPEVRIQGEIIRTTNQLNSFADLVLAGDWVQATIDKGDPDRKPLPKPDIRKMYFPIGPIVVFGASNFPLAFSTAGGDTASALAAGCSVIVKSHPAHPRTSALVAQAIARSVTACDVPEFVFQHIEDSSIEVGQQLVKHALTKGVAFTGSFHGGKALFDLAVNRTEPIPVFAEMGSVNPVVVLPDAMISNESLPSTLSASVLQGVGQFCTNPGLIVALECEGLPLFLQQLSNLIDKAAPARMLHSGIAESYRRRKAESLAQSGVSVLSRVEDGEVGFGSPALAVVNASDYIANPNLQEEVFGPFSLIVRCSNARELKSVIGCTKGQLTATVFGTGEDYRIYSQEILSLKQVCGRLIFNNVPTGVEVCKAMHHGGPYPSTTDSRFTSVGSDAIYRFVRPVSFQNAPMQFLPVELQDHNQLNIIRCVNNIWTHDNV